MTADIKSFQEIPLFASHSKMTTEGNKTGSWRFMRPKFEEKTAPCSAACPAAEDIPRIEMLASRGLFREAYQTILMENPLPGVCGRVCFHPCESSCNRGTTDQPIAIHHLERFLGDTALEADIKPFRAPFSEKTKKRIAIAGSGPAGLSAAYFLSLLGYDCDIFEAQSEPGGVLRWGIPSYRLPEDILKKEIERITELGVRIYCKTPITHEFLETAKKQYSALFIGCGYGRSLRMGITGEEMANDGLKLLHDIRNGGSGVCFSGTAAVIGGGNTAIDVVRSLIRMGSKPHLIYRRRKQDMPAFSDEIEMAIKEGVKFTELAAPVRIQARNGDLLLTLQKMKPLESETRGRARVVPDRDKTMSIKVQQVFTAIGAEPGEGWYLPQKTRVFSFPRPTLETMGKMMELSHCTILRQYMPIVFGGDLTNPTKSVTDAIASGKQAAIALDTFFKEDWNAIEKRLEECRAGTGNSLEIYLGRDRKNRSRQIVSDEKINADYFPHADRMIPCSLSPEESIGSFSEVGKAFSTAQAIEEAGRCFNCGICNECNNCRLFCPEMSVVLGNARDINTDYCKGCGICAAECPRGVMTLEEEKL